MSKQPCTHPDTTSLHFAHSEAALLLHPEPDRETLAHGGTPRTSFLLASKGFPVPCFICCHESCLHHLLCPRMALVHTLQQHLSSRPLVFPADLLADGKHTGFQHSQPCTCHKLLLGTPTMLLILKMGDKCTQAKR